MIKEAAKRIKEVGKGLLFTETNSPDPKKTNGREVVLMVYIDIPLCSNSRSNRTILRTTFTCITPSGECRVNK